MPRVILDLSHDELGIVLRLLPDAEDIAHAAEVCKAFKVGSQRATAARVAASPVPLPSAKPLYVVGTKFADEPKLRRLRWAEAVAPPLTLAGGFCHCFCVSGGALIAWGGDSMKPCSSCERAAAAQSPVYSSGRLRASRYAKDDSLSAT